MYKKADLHIHSFHSDGTMSPEEILNRAIKNNLELIAITDHDVLEGSKTLIDLAKNQKINCISGAELDAVSFDINFHILAYGVDFDNEEFCNFVEKNRKLLEYVDVLLIKKMENNYDNISLEDYNNYSYDRTKGGWKTLHYFVEKGISNNLFECFSIYSKYNHSYTCVDFPSVDEVCRQIHGAGGKAVLAHPGKVIKKQDLKEFGEELYKLIACGIDGIECYYPSHSEEITTLCLDICNENNLLITCGSDCHGEFQETKIGQINIGINQLSLGGLINKFK